MAAKSQRRKASKGTLKKKTVAKKATAKKATRTTRTACRCSRDTEDGGKACDPGACAPNPLHRARDREEMASALGIG